MGRWKKSMVFINVKLFTIITNTKSQNRLEVHCIKMRIQILNIKLKKMVRKKKRIVNYKIRKNKKT